MGICYLVGAGGVTERILPAAGDLVIAVDGGLGHLARRGIRPHLAVGDFDSGSAPEGGGIPVIRHPAVKDDTDMMLALREGAARGYTEFYLFGGMSGARFDHTVANIQLMLHGAEKGLTVTSFLGYQRTRVLRNGEKLTLPDTVCGYFSVFALGGIAEGVTVTGGKYTLTDATLTPSMPLGVSNEPLVPPVTVFCRTGMLLVTWQESEKEHEQ